MSDSSQPSAAVPIPVVTGYTNLVAINSGGSSVIYSAHDERHQRRVAIKSLVTKTLDASIRDGFVRELHAMGRLSDHPHIVSVFDSGFADDGSPFLVMPLFSKGSYADRIRERGPLGWVEAVDLAIKTLSALETAHQRNVTHRDIKPSNIFVGHYKGHPVLGDFGISTLASSEKTTTRSVAYTLAYVAPEVLDGERQSKSSDIYSLGATLRALLVGEAPFTAKNNSGLITKILTQEPCALPDDVPREVVDLVDRLMARKASGRPANGHVAAQEFQQIQEQYKQHRTEILINEVVGREIVVTAPPPGMAAENAAASSAEAGPGNRSFGSAPADQTATETRSPKGYISSLSSRIAAALRRSQPSTVLEPLDAPTHSPALAETVAPTGGAVPIAEVGERAVAPEGKPASKSRVSRERTVAPKQASAPNRGASRERTVAPKPEPAPNRQASQEQPVASKPYGSGKQTGDSAPKISKRRLLRGLGLGVATVLIFSVAGVAIFAALTATDSDPTTGGPTESEVDEQDRSRLKGHTGLVSSVSFSPDGEAIASGSWDESIIIWDAESGAQQQQLTVGNGAVWSLAYSPDGEKLVVASDNDSASLWSTTSGQLLHSFKGHLGTVWSVAYSPSGDVVATASEDKTIRLWDVDSGAEIRVFDDQLAGVFSVSFSPDGKLLVAGSRAGDVTLWDVESGRQRFRLSGHDGNVQSVAVSPDGESVASGGEDKAILVWDVETGEKQQALSGHEGAVLSVAFSPSGKMIGSADESGEIWLWREGDGEPIGPNSETVGAVYSIAFSPDGETLVSGDSQEVALSSVP